MPKQHFIVPTVPEEAPVAARLGAGNLEAQRLDYREEDKFVRLVGESRYDLCAVGNEIEGQITSLEIAPQNGFTIGSVQKRGYINVTFNGLQATPGVGVATIGAYVVAGTPVAKGTALTGHPNVCVATTPANVVFKWRIVSLGAVGTGAVGTEGVIERI